MNVLNGEPFIKYQLDSIYNHAYEIIIVEGAYEKFSHAASPGGRSVDGTIEIIDCYHDPDNKIKFVQKEGFYKDRLDMCNEFLEHVTGDVIWQVDADEFYLDSTHIYVKNIFSSNLELDRICFNFYDFFGSLDYYIKGYEYIGLDNVRRVHRYNQGERWLNQRPPVLTIHEQEKIIRKEMNGSQMQSIGHMMFHPTLLFDKQVSDKYQYYSSISSSINKPNKWIDSVWYKYQNKFNVSGIKNYITYLERFDGKMYPDPLVDMYLKVKKGEYKGFNVRNMNDVDKFMKSPLSRSYQEIAQNLFQNLYIDSSNSQYIKILRVVFTAIRKLDKHTLLHFLRVVVLQLAKKIKK
jgi:hypothetical protein